MHRHDRHTGSLPSFPPPLIVTIQENTPSSVEPPLISSSRCSLTLRPSSASLVFDTPNTVSISIGARTSADAGVDVVAGASGANGDKRKYNDQRLLIKRLIYFNKDNRKTNYVL